MKQDETIGVRVPHELRTALEQERRRMSKAAGAEVKMSSVIRAILERDLRKSARRSSARRHNEVAAG